MDREKVIKETEDGIAFAESRGLGGLANTMRDALALLKEQQEQIDRLLEESASNAEMAEGLKELLKEQEAIEPTFRQGEDGVFVWACGSCGAYMYHIYDGIDKAKEYAKYCRQCGRKVKWE